MPAPFSALPPAGDAGGRFSLRWLLAVVLVTAVRVPYGAESHYGIAWIFLVPSIFSRLLAICVSLEKNVVLLRPFHSWVIYPFMVDLQEFFVHSGY